MNRIHALRYSSVLDAVIPVSELCTCRVRGRSAGRRGRSLKVCALTGVLVGCWAPSAFALPSGGQVAAGQVTIERPSATTLNVEQGSRRGIVNWQSFGINAKETVNFVQPSASSVTLNRVVGADPTAIYGHLNANGQVFLVNPNGVLFAPGASVNVGGIVASTLGIGNRSFLSGNYHFSGGGNGRVINRGSIKVAKGGYVALIGPQVSNRGSIDAPQGAVALGAGGAVNLTLADNSLVSYRVSASAVDAAVSNGGAIHAAGGRVILSARAENDILKTVVNNTGVIVADSAVNKGGTITLLGGGSGRVQVSGTLSASSQSDAGGTIAVTGKSVAIKTGAQVSATGSSGGGTIDVGGDLHGGSLPLATTTRVAAGAVLDASATGAGDGGHVSVVSDTANPASLTTVNGTLLADAGPLGGNGGLIETSGALLDIAGIGVRAAAPKGNPGQWLLDPTMIEITSSTSGVTTTNASGTETFTGTGTSTVAASDIETALDAGTNVTVQTSGLANGGAFDVWVLAPIQMTSGGPAMLTLQAANSVYVGAPISSTGGPLNVNLYCGNDGGTLTGTGAVLLAADITTDGGTINFGTNQTYTNTQSGVTQLAGGDVYVDSQLNPVGSAPATSKLITLDTSSSTGSGGNVNIYGQTLIANPAGFAIDSAHTGTTGTDGNVLFAGTVDSGNSFQYVSGGYTWDQALTASASGTGANVGDSYLATIPTSLINAVASFTTNYTQAWLGGERLVASTPTGTPNPSDTTTLDNKWYWVSGPLGLVPNASSPTGYGTAFFTQNGTTTQNGQSGTAIGGAYTNWNPSTSLSSGNLGSTGEPNNYNGANLTPSGANEYVLQFVGTAGQWNDLSPSNTMGYVKETNVAAAPLTVDAGTGSVTLGAGVGTNSPLQSFNATGGVIDLPQNPAINTTTGTTINGQVQVSDGAGGYLPSTLLTVAAVSQAQDYGATPPGALPITYTVQGGTGSSTPPTNVGAASQSWATTPTSSSDVGIYDATVSGATWNGSGSNPYTFLYVNGALTINPAPVSVSGVTAVSRSYNGSNAVGLTGTPTLTGLLNGASGSVTGSMAGTVASADVQLSGGVPQPQAVTTNFGFTLSSGNAADYTFVQPSLTATLTPATISASGISAVSRAYNGTNTVALTGTGSLTGLFGSDAGSVTGPMTGTVASADVQLSGGVPQAQAVTPNLGFSLTSGHAADYTFTQPSGLTATITPATVSVGGLSAVSRPYDGTNVIALTGTPSPTGLYGSDSGSITGSTTTGTVASPNVQRSGGVPQAQAVSTNMGFTLSSGNAADYTFAQPSLTTTITPAPLGVTDVSLASKVYDGTSNVTVLGSQLTGLIGGDQVSLVSKASVDPLAIGAAVPVTFHDSLLGPAAGNYTVVQPQGLTVAVLPQTQNVVAPVQSGLPTPAQNSSSVSTSSATVPPLVINAGSSSVTSIAVVDGGVNAPAATLQNTGFSKTLPSSMGADMIDVGSTGRKIGSTSGK